MVEANFAEFKIRKLSDRGRIEIWLVDGNKIRTNLEKEFTNFGQHFRFPVIPENEFWIDQERAPDERGFFIDHLLVEWRLMKQGKDYNPACDAADAKERSERERTRDQKKVAGSDGEPQPTKVHIKNLQTLKNGVKVWLVDGRLVRSAFRVEFTEGGHDMVYVFVPEKEVWVDNDLVSEERPYVILHELYERQLMEKDKLTYSRAHRKASRLEWESRRDEVALKKNLAAVGWVSE